MKQHLFAISFSVLIILAAVALFFFWNTRDRGHAPSAPMLAAFYCAEGKTIDVAFTPDSAAVKLSDGRSFTLPQTISGSGARYESTSTPGTDIVFWNKGDTAFIMENNATTFDNCVTGMLEAGGSGLNTFVNSEQTFSFSFPSQFSLMGYSGGYTQNWSEQATTSGMLLAEVDIPKSYAPGTNFGDAKFTIGTSADPNSVAMCLANPKVSYQDAGAGNRYDTTSYRTVRNNQCYAIEYTIHYSVFENYPAGSITRFDEASVQKVLDAMAQSFKFLQ